jgi:hypothetical protein
MLIKMNSGRILLALSLPLCFAGAAQAQTPFEIVAQSGTNTVPVADGSTLTLAAGAVGQSTSMTITLTYEGTTSAVVSQPTLSSTNGFGIGNSSISSTPLQFGQAVSFTVTYTPTTAAQATNQLTVPFTQSGATSNSAGTVGSLIFILSGTAPNMVVAYALSTNGNVNPIASGSTITVPPTVVGLSTTVGMIIANQGSGPGSIQSIKLSGDPSFSLQSLSALLPVQSLAAGSDVTFSVLYAPTQTGTNNGMLTIGLANNQTVTLALQGTARASLFTYQLVQGTQTTPLTPGQTISFPNTNVGSQSSVTIQVTNANSTTVTDISAAISPTTVFSINGLINPFTLIVGATTSFNITFAPTQSGAVTAQLQVGNDSFPLSATAIGTQLVYSYTSGSASTTVASGGIVSFPPETVGQSESTTFTIQNNGTNAAQITSIGVSGTQTTPPTFSVPNPPQLPLSLPAGQNMQFTISFAPQTTGQSTAPLVINDQQFTLSGFGNAPAAIPSYQFTGSSGAQTPLTQAAVGLSLASQYPLALNGKLTLTVNTGSLPADPSVQFSSSGQTVTFTIPQGSTQAVFPSGSNQIGLQTGSVAGTITITPSFALASGLDMTPASPATLSLSVPSGPVQLTNAVISAETATTLTLQVTGYATTRDLATLSFQFTPQTSTNLSTSSITVPIGPYAQQWFSSTQSDSFGGQFTVSVPFTLSNGQTTTTTTTTTSLVSLLQSVSVTATNSAGTSNAVSVASLTQ